jgi:N-acetylmuramoyl-L-alanine amidase
MRTIVLDAGHGGVVQAGRSSPFGVRGPTGASEKSLTLDLARRIGGELSRMGHVVVLTRDDDVAMSMKDRILVSKEAAADVFLSLHFNGADGSSEQGCEVLIHDRAREDSRALARALLDALCESTGHDGRGTRAAQIAVLDPERHAPSTAACLAEVSFLTNPEEERRLRTTDYRSRLASALAGTLDRVLRDGSARVHREVRSRRSERFDIWHEVPLVPQLTGMSCWAAAAAMIVGWRDCVVVDPKEVATASGYFREYEVGIAQHDLSTLASSFGLTIEPPRAYDVESLRGLVERFGPLWVGAASPGLHVVVIAGMYGDGRPTGTFVRIVDPWPEGKGRRLEVRFDELRRSFDEAEQIVGEGTRVLHASGRGGCGTRKVEVRSESRVERIRIDD